MAGPGGAALVCTLQRDLDSLDLEIVERAVQGVSDAIKAGATPADLESDEELELRFAMGWLRWFARAVSAMPMSCWTY